MISLFFNSVGFAKEVLRRLLTFILGEADKVPQWVVIVFFSFLFDLGVFLIPFVAWTGLGDFACWKENRQGQSAEGAWQWTAKKLTVYSLPPVPRNLTTGTAGCQWRLKPWEFFCHWDAVHCMRWWGALSVHSRHIFPPRAKFDQSLLSGVLQLSSQLKNQ